MPWEPAPASPAPKRGARRRRWLGITAAVVVVALIGAGVAYFELRPPNWYADGMSAELAAEQHDDALLTGPVSTLPTTCTAKMNAAGPSQRPAKTDTVSVQQWLQGCEAAYHQQHPNQLVEDGIMWPSGTKACSKSCSSQWSAAGQRIALAANQEPLINSNSAAADWCADLASNRFIKPLPAKVESQLRAHAPAAGPETYSWNQGCAAQYGATQANGPAQPGAPVTVTGSFGISPDLTIPETAPPSSLYIKTLYQGTGAKVTSSEGMVCDYISYEWSAATNKPLESSFSQGTPSLFVGPLLTGLEKALIGQRVGSRVVVVMPPADAFGSAGDKSRRIGPDESLVFVVDINSAFSAVSVPGKQTSDGGGALPVVTPPAPGSTHGPTIVIPAGVTPPATLTVKPLIKGTGPFVRRGDQIAVQYTGVNWRTGQVFNSTWPVSNPLIAVIGVGQAIKGWDTGLVGQTIGSRVLLVVPPADGYGSAGQSQAGIGSTDTIAYVVDILAAT